MARCFVRRMRACWVAAAAVEEGLTLKLAAASFNCERKDGGQDMY